MVVSKSTASPHPSAYRVDVIHGDQGSDTFRVVRCSPVASFDNPEHAAFLVELLQAGQESHLTASEVRNVRIR